MSIDSPMTLVLQHFHSPINNVDSPMLLTIHLPSSFREVCEHQWSGCQPIGGSLRTKTSMVESSMLVTICKNSLSLPCSQASSTFRLRGQPNIFTLVILHSLPSPKPYTESDCTYYTVIYQCAHMCDVLTRQGVLKLILHLMASLMACA